tara:strand:+ start:4644 stop:5489 length:846 start_codon:yes stop_codon:yes gene_type:complete
MIKVFFENQHKELKRLISENPTLEDLVFQGKTLSWHASSLGLQKLLESVNKKDFDPIALNHGIKRYLIDNYKKDLIWDYPKINKDISYSDPFISDLNENFKEIKSEVMNIISLLKKFPDSDDLTNETGQWNFIPFYEKDGTPIKTTLDNCPTISNLLDKQEINTDLGFVFVSSLDSYSSIAAHTGSTALRKRYHFPIEVPEIGQSKIRIGSEWISWEPGKAFSFYDAVEHEVVHKSDKNRIILIVDVWPECLPKELICVLKKNKSIFRYATESQKLFAIND